MKKIISDFGKRVRPFIIRFWIGTILIFGILFISRSFSEESTRVMAFIIFGVIILILLFNTVEYLFLCAARFKKKFTSLPKTEQDEIAEQYEKTKPLNEKWFLEDYLLCFRNDIILIKYSDIQKVELWRHKLRLHLTDNTIQPLPTRIDENPAMIVALLRSKNPDISAMIDGKVVESMENKR